MIEAHEGHTPEIEVGAFVHERATVIGMVQLGRSCSVWPSAVIRADRDLIIIGDESNVQDGAVLHADPGLPCLVGARVSVGHLACVHGCRVEDEVIIGIGAIVLNGAEVGGGSIIGAGAVVPEQARIPPGSLVFGVPGRVVRAVTGEDLRRIRTTAARYVEMAERAVP